jgi:hypothetical protein
MQENDTPAKVGSMEGLGGWIPVAERLPELDQPVWLYESGRAFIGCRSDGGGGWLWAQCYVVPSLDDQGNWQAVDADADDDYQPTLWQPLPDVPRYSQTELDVAAERGKEIAASLRVE